MINQKREHILKSLDTGKRYDGRALDEFRRISIEVGTIKNAEGSAQVKIGNTEVFAGVKLAVEQPYPDTPDKGNLMVNAELLPLSSPRFEAGPPSEEAIEIARLIDRGVREAKIIDQKALCLVPKEEVWGVMIDVATINTDGNIIDSSALASVAALKNAKMPKYEDGSVKYDELTENGIPLDLGKIPVTVTVHKIGKHLLVDPIPDEECVTDARLTVAVLEDDTIVALQKGGAYPLTVDDVEKMVGLAQRKSADLRKLI